MKTNLTIREYQYLSTIMDNIISDDLLTDRREYDADDLMTMYDLHPEQSEILYHMIQTESFRTTPTRTKTLISDDDKTIDTRRFDDSSFCINPIMLYLMSLDYSIIDLTFDADDEIYYVQLMMPDFNAHPDSSKLNPMRRRAIIQIESEGATLTIHESHE